MLILFLNRALKKKYQSLLLFCGETLVPRLIGKGFREKQKSRVTLVVLAMLFLILAMTQPRWGYRWEEVRRQGVDLVVALDISNSMLAEDVKPNRLERAKHKIRDLLNMLEGDRIGLVVFAGTAYVQLPLTLDYTAARLFLSAIDTDLISTQGTALGKAIRTSVKAFNSGDKKSRAILLITDGEDQTKSGLEEARRAREEGARIYTIGIGREIGAPIPNPNSEGGFKKDSRGEVVLTKLDEVTLQKIALETGGTYVRSVTGDLDLIKIYQENIKQKIEKKELKGERRKLWQERFQWMIFIALAFLTWEFLVNERKQGPLS
jgi:Ca-activated chloride channel family protein